MFINPIPPYMSNHPTYAARFAEQIAAVDKTQAGYTDAGKALAEARSAEKQATADRVAGKRNAPHADQMAAIVAEAEHKSRSYGGARDAALAALSQAVHSDGAFVATAALDHLREASPAITAAIGVLMEFFGDGMMTGSYDHAAQRVNLPPARYVFGRSAHDPGQRLQAISMLRAHIDAVHERIAGATEAQPPAPVHAPPMTEARLHGHTDLGAGTY